MIERISLSLSIYIYIQRITMCPHGYHHSGSMATPALGTRDVRLHIVWIALSSHKSAQTASSERCIVQKVNVPQGGSPPNPRECSNCTGSERNIQRITMCPHNITLATDLSHLPQVYNCSNNSDDFMISINMQPHKLDLYQ